MGERIRRFISFGASSFVFAACSSTDVDSMGFDRPSLCSLPFDSGPCDALIDVYAYVDGSCELRTYGGCEGNDNRFTTLEECLVTCEGRPEPNGCPPDRVRASICIGCGPVGGCSETLDACAEPCSESTPCTASGFGCWEGVCQAAFCE